MDRQYFTSSADSLFFGGRLIDLGPGNDLDVTQAPVIKHSLSVDEDREAIEAFELTNMRGGVTTSRTGLFDISPPG